MTPSDAEQAFVLAVGRRIAAERHAAGYSQRDFAKVSGVSKESLQRYEHGERQAPLGTLFKIADALGIEPEDLMRAARAQTVREQRRAAQTDT